MGHDSGKIGSWLRLLTLARSNGRWSDWRQWCMRERRLCVCCRQDRRKAGQEPGGGTYLDTSIGEGRVSKNTVSHMQNEIYPFTITGTIPSMFKLTWLLKLILIVNSIFQNANFTSCYLRENCMYKHCVLLSGIGSKSMPFLGTWIKGTSERSSTHLILSNHI